MPRYEYSCVTCGGSVTKPPVFTPDGDSKLKTKGIKAATRIGLGGWRCPKDGPTKVSRTLVKDGD